MKQLLHSCSHRSKTEEISSNIFVLGSLDPVWRTTSAFQKCELASLKKVVGNWGKIWRFKRCQIDGIVYHSQSYQRVTARNNYTIAFKTNEQSTSSYGSIISYAKLQQQCHQASCRSRSRCQCQLHCYYFAIVQEYDLDDGQLPSITSKVVITHIKKVKSTTRVIAISLASIKEKCVLVDVSSGTYICHLANNYESD